MIIITLPFILFSWFIIYFSTASWHLLIARFLLGLLTGFLSDPAVSYVSEMSQEHIRGRLVSTIDVNRVFGVLFVFVVGSSFKWRELALYCGLASTIPVLIGFLYLPSSFRWLITKGRQEEALESLKFFRKTSEKELLAEFNQTIDNTQNETTSFIKQFKLLSKVSNIKRLMVVSLISCFTQFSGLSLMINYSTLIMNTAFENFIDEYFGSMILGFTRLFSIILFMFIVESFKRKSLYFASFLISAASMACLGIFYTLFLYDIKYSLFIPFGVLVAFELAISMCDSVISLLRCEVTPHSIRALGMSISMIFFCIGGFIAVKSFPIMIGSFIGLNGAFFIYSFFCALMAFLIRFTIPETKGKVLEDIE